jgi:hypothetical protein
MQSSDEKDRGGSGFGLKPDFFICLVKPESENNLSPIYLVFFHA